METINNQVQVITTEQKTENKDLNTSIWQGTAWTAENVAGQIAERFGADAAKRYDPLTNCFTYKRWKAEGYHVRKGEKALKSVTWVPFENEDGTRGRFPKTVNLFFIDQVDKITNE